MANEDILKDLSQIRVLMEKSTKFISISGLSGIIIGIFTFLALFYIHIMEKSVLWNYESLIVYPTYNIFESIYFKTAIVLLITSISTGVLLAMRKAFKENHKLWTKNSKVLLNTIGVPLFAGGVFALVSGAYGANFLVIPSLLVFYGIALFTGGYFTFREIRIVGILDVVLGLLCLGFFRYGLLFFGLGFGVLHMVYGLVMMKKYGA